jgi:hypothetical protein
VLEDIRQDAPLRVLKVCGVHDKRQDGMPGGDLARR